MKKYSLLLFNFIFIIFMDIIFKLCTFNNLFNITSLYILLFDLIIAIIITIIESLFNSKVNKIIFIFFVFIIWLMFSSQFIYYKYYETIFSIYSMFHGAQVFGFSDSIISVIWQNIIPVLSFTLPLILSFISLKFLDFEKRNMKFILINTCTFLFTYAFCLILIFAFNDKSTYSTYNLYYNTHVAKLTVRDLGVLTEMRMDFERSIFGFKEKINVPVNKKIETNNNENEETKTEYNVLEIDFDELIKNETDTTIKEMHSYFSNASPTNKNEYTGMFEGKNLIVIVAEAFSPMSINKTLTPTLYKLYNEGFQFENFYTPVYYVSTSDGEYISLTGLLPKDGTWSMSKSSDIYLPFVYGNLFKNYGYNTYAFHNGEYTYYNRHKSLPNMGYIYKACYNGLDINCRMWPQSDIEMIEASVDDYINSEHFMTYYLTVSGHLQYTYNGNSIATKNKKYVEDLPYNEGIQAYLATQIELDKAVQLLIDKLDEAGKLDDTVIAISADHYPYGLTDEQILGYADYIDDKKFDIHKNNFLLWNSTMKESIKIDKYASSLDILPTILNLFNAKYDSRLMVGTDILSDSDGLVIYNDRSFINKYGKYDSITETFTPFKDNFSEEYIENINSEIYNKFLMSKLILDNDYYSKVFKKSS